MRMQRGTAALLIAAVAVAVPLAGCGKAKPKLPRTDARALIRLLHRVDALDKTTASSCATLAHSTLPELELRVNTLPAKTDPDIRGTLQDGVSNLRNLVAVDCTQVKPTPPPATQTQTQTQPPPTTTTTSPPSTTTTSPPTTTTTPKPPPSTSTQPNTSGGAGAGGGGGGGNGNGAGK
jgi:hypothetical protein